MSSVDDRVVSMQFDNVAFERRMSQTLDSLDKLSESLKLVEAQRGLTNVSSQVNSFDGQNMASAVENISSKFNALGAVGFTVIQELTKAVGGFLRGTSQDILGPVLVGGKKRATNIENAKFQFRGLGIDVEDAMASALAAVKGTAFGLDEAAKAAAQFGASGIEAGDKMTTALRGIAGAAAMTNTSFAEIADIYTSAAGSGIVNNNDLSRFATRGLNATAALAKEFGITEQAVKEMARAGELSFEKFAQGMDDAFGEHATKANETYTGSLANLKAALARIGAGVFGTRMEHQRDIFNALTPVVDGLNDSLQPLIKSFLAISAQSTKNLVELLGNVDLTNFSKGIENIAAGVDNLVGPIREFASIAFEAFRDIFPKSEVSIFVSFTEAFKNFTENLKIGGKTAEDIKSVFKGVFSVFAIGFEIVKEVFKLFAGLAGTAFGKGGGGALSFAGDMGDALTYLKEALVDGGAIASFFQKIGDAIRNPMKFIEALKQSIRELFTSGTIPGGEYFLSVMSRASERFETLRTLADKLGSAWEWLSSKFEAIAGVLDTVWGYISDWFSTLGDKIANVMNPSDFDNAVDAVNIGLLGGLIFIFKKFTGEGFKVVFRTGLIERLRLLWVDLTRTLKVMQAELKVKILLQIAAAIAVLTASMLILSTIDSAALTKALAAMAVGFGQLIGVMALIEKMDLGITGAKMMGLAAGMILISGAAVILSVAIKNLSSLGWEELAKGLVGVGVALVALTGATRLIAADTSGLIRAGFAMGVMAVGLLILSKAVKSFAELSWEEMAKGFVGVAVGLGALTVAMRLMPPGMMGTSIGLIAVSTALVILSKAVEAFADISWGDMAKGFVGIGVGLVIIAGAMNLMPLSLPITAAGLVLVAGAMLLMAKAVEKMGSIGIGELAKGIGSFAIMLGVLSASLILMSGTVGGSIALGIASVALLGLTKVLREIGQLPLSQIATGIATIAAVLGVIGVAAALIQPVLPALYGLGAGLLLLGGAFALFGLGASLVAKAFEVIAKVGRESIEVLLDVVELFIKALPRFAGALVESLHALVGKILDIIPTLLKALTVLVSHILDTIIELTPKFGETFKVMLLTAIDVIRSVYPEFLTAGFEMLLAFLQGIRDNIFEIVTLATEIVISFAEAINENVQALVDAGLNLIFEFLGAVSSRMAEIVASGVNLLVSFISGLTDNIHLVVQAVEQLIVTFLAHITLSLSRIVTAGTNMLIYLLNGISNNINKVITVVGDIIIKFIEEMAGKAIEISAAGAKALADFLYGIADNIETVGDAAGDVVTEFIETIGDNATIIASAAADALTNFLDGIADNIEDVGDSAVKVAEKFMDTIAAQSVALARSAADALVDFLDGLADAIRDKSPRIRAAGRNIASALVEGLTGGLSANTGKVVNKVTGLASGAVNAAKSFFGIRSPSKVFENIGKNLADGLAKGVGDDSNALTETQRFGKRVTDALQVALTRIPDDLSGIDEFSPTIRPVLDLSKVQADAKNISGYLGASNIRPELSLAQARSISSASAVVNDDVPPASTGQQSEINFIQNNYSPKELSTNDIYRNTRSQIALAKEELNVK